jgi:hypothetical protein
MDIKVITDKNVREEVNGHKKIGPVNGKEEGTSKGQIGKLPLSN